MFHSAWALRLDNNLSYVQCDHVARLYNVARLTDVISFGFLYLFLACAGHHLYLCLQTNTAKYLSKAELILHQK